MLELLLSSLSTDHTCLELSKCHREISAGKFLWNVQENLNWSQCNVIGCQVMCALVACNLIGKGTLRVDWIIIVIRRGGGKGGVVIVNKITLLYSRDLDRGIGNP